MRADPESVRTQSSHRYHYTLWGSAHVKDDQKMLMKLTPGRKILVKLTPPRNIYFSMAVTRISSNAIEF